jgi:hypothetical protein
MEGEEFVYYKEKIDLEKIYNVHSPNKTTTYIQYSKAST